MKEEGYIVYTELPRGDLGFYFDAQESDGIDKFQYDANEEIEAEKKRSGLNAHLQKMLEHYEAMNYCFWSEIRSQRPY